MPCAFHYKRPAPFDDLDPGCQFDEPDRRLIEYRGKQWCYFHLPKEAKIPERHENLPACINDHKERLISTPDKSEYIDLSGVNVRRAITINGDRDNIIRRILFASSTFYGGAVFNKVKFHENCIFSESEFGAYPLDIR
ncbi:MAG: hypothetical protein K8F27_02010 [Sulfuricellaceae bacterium]|nr:hypothetical protein [Sulfuricellaceae bacterium]